MIDANFISHEKVALVIVLMMELSVSLPLGIHDLIQSKGLKPNIQIPAVRYVMHAFFFFGNFISNM